MGCSKLNMHDKYPTHCSDCFKRSKWSCTDKISEILIVIIFDMEFELFTSPTAKVKNHLVILTFAIPVCFLDFDRQILRSECMDLQKDWIDWASFVGKYQEVQSA